jgi:hypothetical protein
MEKALNEIIGVENLKGPDGVKTDLVIFIMDGETKDSFKR